MGSGGPREGGRRPRPPADAVSPAGRVKATGRRVHHKPGHHGGQPWLQRNQTRDEWREDRWDYGGYYGRDRPYTVCRTTYRTYFDPYTGEYVERPVRVCG